LDEIRATTVVFPFRNQELSSIDRRHPRPRAVTGTRRIDQHQNSPSHAHCLRLPRSRATHCPRHARPWRLSTEATGSELTHGNDRRATFLRPVGHPEGPRARQPGDHHAQLHRPHRERNAQPGRFGPRLTGRPHPASGWDGRPTPVPVTRGDQPVSAGRGVPLGAVVQEL
jgi:hypothetical protein